MKKVMIVIGILFTTIFLFSSPQVNAQIDVFVYTETTQWIAQPAAQVEADILIDMIKGENGIGEVVNEPAGELEDWTVAHTKKKGQLIVLFGDIPPEIYPQGNAKPEGSIAEEFLDAGNTFSNTADYFFWGQGNRNAEGGLQNMMDIPGILQWDDNTPMKVTPEGKELTPTLAEYQTDRPFHVDQLANDWELEIAFATNTGQAEGSTRCDPCIFHNTKTGARLIQAYQTANQDDPKGEVLAEIILNYYIETVGAQAVDPAKNSPHYGETLKQGDKLMRKFVILTTLIALLALPLNHVFAAGEVVIYTGTTQWIVKDAADEQANICVDMLNDAGINNTLLASDGDMDALATWMENVTGDNGFDICVLYGDIPPTLYPQGNAQPDGSIAESYIETTDGDAIINHADYMFWGLGNRNAEGGLQNMMDIPGIVMWDDNTPMIVTDDGKEIAPSLPEIQSDRPFHIDQLADDWEVEVSLAQNDAGTRADPIIVRDGDRGRLIPVIQTANGDEPKGAVAAEIIIWLMANATSVEPEGKLSTTWGNLKAVR